MSDTNQITVRGRVGTQPDVLVTPNGKEVTKFRLGSTRSYRDAAGEWRDTETEWFTVKTWGAAAGLTVRQSIRKGMPVIVQGVLSSEEWVSGDRTHHTNVITAGTIGVDVKYGLVTFARITRQAAAGEAGNGPVESGASGDGPVDGAAGLDGLSPDSAAEEDEAPFAPEPPTAEEWVKVAP